MKWLRTLFSKTNIGDIASHTNLTPGSSFDISPQAAITQSSVPTPTPPFPPAPNEVGAVTNHFSQLLPALVGTVLAVLIAALSNGFPQRAIFEPVYCGHIVVILGVFAGFLFYDGVQQSYFAQSQNLAGMEAETRKAAFNGIDPFAYYDNDAWKAIINGYMTKARLYSRKAIWRLEIGTILLFYSIAMVLFAYFFWLGLSAIFLVTIYSLIDIKKILVQLKGEKKAKDLISKQPRG